MARRLDIGYVANCFLIRRTMYHGGRHHGWFKSRPMCAARQSISYASHFRVLQHDDSQVPAAAGHRRASHQLAAPAYGLGGSGVMREG